MTHRKTSLLVAALFGMQSAVTVALDMPWSDAAKYRTECRRSCFEDSFGKARANEIKMRCKYKCDHLPLSPKEQWKDYDECAALLADYRAFQKNNFSLLESCSKNLQAQLGGCDKKFKPKTNAKSETAYVPGQITIEYLRRDNVEQCRAEVKKSISKECREVELDLFVKKLSAPEECIKPIDPRPR